MIVTPAQLAAFNARLRAAPWVAMDTEADSLHSYPEKVCLIQFSLAEEDTLVDPLSGLDLASLWETLAERQLILHGADYDLRMLYRGYRFVPHEVFDTMLAARLAGLREFGLSALVESLLGVRLDKSPQKANWSRRPLTDRMLAYARADTHHLRPLTDLLRERLAAAQRLDWHAQTCAQLIRDCTTAAAEINPDAWRIKGSNRLGRRALAVVRGLWQWREKEAVAANQPPFFVLSHDRLLALAEAAGRGENVAALVPARFSPRRARALLEALDQALAEREAGWPLPLATHGRRLTQAQKRRLEQLEAHRNRRAEALNLESSLIASRATLVDLAHDWDLHAPALLPWQRELLALPRDRPAHGRPSGA